MDVFGVEPIVDLFARAPARGDACPSEESEMVADGRLREAEQLAEARDVSFAVAQDAENPQACGVREQAEDTTELFEFGTIGGDVGDHG